MAQSKTFAPLSNGIVGIKTIIWHQNRSNGRPYPCYECLEKVEEREKMQNCSKGFL
jgi:hypothetical protein